MTFSIPQNVPLDAPKNDTGKHFVQHRHNHAFVHDSFIHSSSCFCDVHPPQATKWKTMSGNRYCQSPQSPPSHMGSPRWWRASTFGCQKWKDTTTFHRVIWSEHPLKCLWRLWLGNERRHSDCSWLCTKNTKEENIQQGVLLTHSPAKSGATVRAELAPDLYLKHKQQTGVGRRQRGADVLFPCPSQKATCANVLHIHEDQRWDQSFTLVANEESCMWNSATAHRWSVDWQVPSQSQKWVTPLRNVLRWKWASCKTEGCH